MPMRGKITKNLKANICIYITLFIASLSAPKSWATMIPENDAYNPAYGNLFKVGVSKEAFFELIDFFEDLYRPQVEALGAEKWEIDGDWYAGDVGAFAMQYSGNWTVTVYGGLARHHAMTVDGLASVICHEIGHHLGGAPKKQEVLWTGWTSVEGQADYYSAAKCFMRYVENISKTFEDQKRYTPSNFLRKKCKAAVKIHPAKNFTEKYCIRSAMAAFSAEEMVRLSLGEEPISFDTPDLAVVDKTYDLHPNSQCRLDTLLAGILCPIDPYEEFDDEDYKVAACHSDFYPEFSRSRCWFNPDNY